MTTHGYTLLDLIRLIIITGLIWEKEKQAGAELGQAQLHLELGFT